jgi:hypothetical protein
MSEAGIAFFRVDATGGLHVAHLCRTVHLSHQPPCTHLHAADGSAGMTQFKDVYPALPMGNATTQNSAP